MVGRKARRFISSILLAVALIVLSIPAQAAQQGVIIDLSGIRQKTTPRVITSARHLQRVFIDLLGNALKYNRVNGSVTVAVKEVERTEETVVCEFTIYCADSQCFCRRCKESAVCGNGPVSDEAV